MHDAISSAMKGATLLDAESRIVRMMSMNSALKAMIAIGTTRKRNCVMPVPRL